MTTLPTSSRVGGGFNRFAQSAGPGPLVDLVVLGVDWVVLGMISVVPGHHFWVAWQAYLRKRKKEAGEPPEGKNTMICT